MCGIAGRILAEPGQVGADLVSLMHAQRHRGADSTGFALYGKPLEDGYIVRAMTAQRQNLSLHEAPRSRSYICRFPGPPSLETTDKGFELSDWRKVLGLGPQTLHPWLFPQGAIPLRKTDANSFL